MARVPTTDISIELLDMILAEFDILDKVNDGRLRTEVAYQTVAKDLSLPDAVSRILKHFTVTGKHIATTHQVLHGSQPHWHGTDFTMYDVKLVRPKEGSP